MSRTLRECSSLYFDLEDYSFYDGDGTLAVTVEVFAGGADAFRIDYDSADPELRGLAQQFRPTAAQPVARSGGSAISHEGRGC